MANGKPGRPSKYTEEIADEICRRLANCETLNTICSDPHMPARPTVIDWTQDADKKAFSDRFARAREVGYLNMADELIDIADDGRNDWIKRKTRGGGEVEMFNKEAAERSKLRVETRKWILTKVLPKIYGEKVQATHEAGDSFRKLWEALGAGLLDETGKKSG